MCIEYFCAFGFVFEVAIEGYFESPLVINQWHDVCNLIGFDSFQVAEGVFEDDYALSMTVLPHY